jgi:hypothetical protein
MQKEMNEQMARDDRRISVYVAGNHNKMLRADGTNIHKCRLPNFKKTIISSLAISCYNTGDNFNISENSLSLSSTTDDTLMTETLEIQSIFTQLTAS